MLYSLAIGFSREGAPLPAQILAGQRWWQPHRLRFSLSHFPSPPHKLETEWEADCDKILRRCPTCQLCQRESIVGHGRCRKQAHDQHHDWITIRRGRCAVCGKTYTFLLCFLSRIRITELADLLLCIAAQIRRTPGRGRSTSRWYRSNARRLDSAAL